MSAGSVAGLLAAAALLVIAGAAAYPLIKLGRVLEETRRTVREMSDGALPLLAEVTTTVTTTNQQLGKVDTITDNVASVSTNVSALTSLFAATLGSPVVKVAAFSYGVRSALSGRKSRGRK